MYSRLGAQAGPPARAALTFLTWLDCGYRM